MTSAINPALPGTGRAFTLDVRQNFAAARREIELLQSRLDGLQQTIEGLGGLQFLPLTGGTLFGPLLLSVASTEPEAAATRGFVEAAVGAVPLGDYLPLAGGTLTGPLLLAGDPTEPEGAATKRYVDEAVPTGGPFLPLTGGTLSRRITIETGPSAPGGSCQLHLRNIGGGGWPGVVLSGPPGTNNFFRSEKDGLSRWSIEFGGGAGETGGNVGTDFIVTRFADDGTSLGQPFVINRATGEITVGADPVSALGVATKQYVDALAARVAALESAA